MSTVAVSCPGGCTRPLKWQATSELHAANLLRKHYREYHAGETVPGDPEPTPAAPAEPMEWLVSQAAATVVWDLVNTTADSWDRGRVSGALAVWQSLTGISDRAEAIALAEAYADDPTAVTAVTPPF